MSLCFTKFPNTEERVENTTHSGEFLTYFEVFSDVVKHNNTVIPSQSKLKISKEKMENKILKIYAENY